MIDTDKYEGHTPAPWQASHDRLEHGCIVNSHGWRVYVGEHEKRAEIQNYAFAHNELSEADARLIAAAPLLLQEVKQLQDALKEAVEVVKEMESMAYADADADKFANHALEFIGNVKELIE